MPAPGAISTKFQIQASGGSGGKCGLQISNGNYATLQGAGAGAGSFVEIVFTEPLLSNIAVTSGSSALSTGIRDEASVGKAGIAGGASICRSANTVNGKSFNIVVYGGGGGVTVSGGQVALIYSSTNTQEASRSITGYSNIETLYKKGRVGTSGYAPAWGHVGFNKGGDGADSLLGSGAVSVMALTQNDNMSGRNARNSQQYEGQGYGFGGCGVGRTRNGTDINTQSGKPAGPGIIIITEYLED